MSKKQQEIVNISDRIWNLCTYLMNAGVSNQDYMNQLTMLIFLKMADEYAKPPYNRDIGIPAKYNWSTLTSKKGADLETHYTMVLLELSKKTGMIGYIFAGALNKIPSPADLQRVMTMIDDVAWTSMEVDTKGEIYESLLERVASDTKSGAGQYFTPRPLIKAMVQALKPEPGKTMADPACGTGGFFLSYISYINETYKDLDREERKRLKEEGVHGWEIVRETARLCAMNLLLHGIVDAEHEPPISRIDSLMMAPSTQYDYVLANPPFGKAGSTYVATESGTLEKETQEYNRQDFWATTTNKQINFMQHIKTLLKATGRAAVVLPDNVLFEGGAGETIRRKFLETTDLHTILRLPTGIFYAQGVKANILFFDNRPASPDPQTKETWIYDLRTNKHFTLKTRKIADEDFADFLKCYNPDNRHQRVESERFKKFTREEILARDKANLDITWLKDDSVEDMDNLPEPEIIAAEIREDLAAALQAFSEVESKLET